MSKGHNFVKNQWIKTKLKLDLYLGMAKPCTKYQMNICKQREKSPENCKISEKGITFESNNL
jgi:hypothetical protein